MDAQLNLSVEAAETAHARHLPFGIPIGDDVDCVLNQTDYVIGYSLTHRLGLWVAFNLKSVSVLLSFSLMVNDETNRHI